MTLQPQDFHLPVLQYGPIVTSPGLLNYDLNSHPLLQHLVQDALKVSHSMLIEVTNVTYMFDYATTANTTSLEVPRTILAEPVYDSFDQGQKTIVGFVFAVVPWTAYLTNILPDEIRGYVVTTNSTCTDERGSSFIVNGGGVDFRGNADISDRKYDVLIETGDFAQFARFYTDEHTHERSLGEEEEVHLHCEYALTVVPDPIFEADYITSQPYLYASVVFMVFLITVSVFVLYDWMVQRRQKKVLGTAVRTTEMVHSLFPKSVGDRLLAEAERKSSLSNNKNRRRSNKDKLAAFISDGDETRKGGKYESEPIAEFFTDTTIMFADMVGFTAWSSSREPKQVFTLLETIYADFDATAIRRRVYKVETIGDCYVAVAGLPEPRADHAVVMARFARDCMYHFHMLTNQLEIALGPETGDLDLRVGLHSGPVTAGVLRGDRARFQLFGDTMNTASRMESNGAPRRIQVSQETATLLQQAGKGHWIRKREDLITAKGKGQMQTYWMEVKGGTRSMASGTTSSDGKTAEMSESSDMMLAASHPNRIMVKKSKARKGLVASSEEEKRDRLVRWTVDVLLRMLQNIGVRRTSNSKDKSKKETEKIRALEQETMNLRNLVIDEVQDIIQFPYSEPSGNPGEADTYELGAAVEDQLRQYIEAIAALYRNNPFHNFEVCSMQYSHLVSLATTHVLTCLS